MEGAKAFLEKREPPVEGEVREKGHLAYITFNRPEVMNAINPPAQQELWDALFDFHDDPEVRQL